MLLRNPSRLGEATAETIDAFRAQLGLPRQSRISRNFHVFVFLAVMGACFVVGITRQFIPELQLGPTCVGCMVGLSQASIKTVVISIVLVIQTLAVIVVRANEIIDQYRIRLELQFIVLVWAAFLIPSCAVSLTATDCENLRLQSVTNNTCSSFNTFTQECYFKVATANWLEVICIILTFLVTIFFPTLVTHKLGREKLLNTGTSIVFPNFRVLESLDECLRHPEAAAAFQTFCISAFCVQNPLFWKDCEGFKRIRDPTELRVRAVAMYNQYLTADGNLFLELPSDLQDEMDDKLGGFADQEDADMDYNFEPDPMLFEKCQAEIFRQMEADAFPRFQRSEDARRLYRQFAATVVQDLGLVEANLVDLPKSKNGSLTSAGGGSASKPASSSP